MYAIPIFLGHPVHVTNRSPVLMPLGCLGVVLGSEANVAGRETQRTQENM